MNCNFDILFPNCWRKLYYEMCKFHFTATVRSDTEEPFQSRLTDEKRIGSHTRLGYSSKVVNIESQPEWFSADRDHIVKGQKTGIAPDGPHHPVAGPSNTYTCKMMFFLYLSLADQKRMLHYSYFRSLNTE